MHFHVPPDGSGKIAMRLAALDGNRLVLSN